MEATASLSAFVLLLCIALYSNAMMLTSRNPINLQLQHHKLQAANASSTDNWPSKTKSLFFQQVLGLRLGEPFDFNLDSWRVLQQCGLYRNLSARSTVTQYGVALNITGYEMPSTTFSPEVSMGLSLSNLDAKGGMVYKNRNFRGLGEQIEVSVLKKEGLEPGTDRLPPAARLLWTDCRLTRQSSVSILAETWHSLENLADFLLVGQRDWGGTGSGRETSRSDRDPCWMMRRQAIGQQRFQLDLSRYWQPTAALAASQAAARKAGTSGGSSHSGWMTRLRDLGCELVNTVRLGYAPYLHLVQGIEEQRHQLSGCKVYGEVRALSEDGLEVTASYDSGRHRLEDRASSPSAMMDYGLVSLQLRVNEGILPLYDATLGLATRTLGRIWAQRLRGEDGQKDNRDRDNKDATIEEKEEQAAPMIRRSHQGGQLRLHYHRWLSANGGGLPALHGLSLVNSNHLRGYPEAVTLGEEDNGSLGSLPMPSPHSCRLVDRLLALSLDLPLPIVDDSKGGWLGSLGGTWAAFVDLGLYSHPAADLSLQQTNYKRKDTEQPKDKQQQAAFLSLGLTYRIAGLKIDLGFPVYLGQGSLQGQAGQLLGSKDNKEEDRRHQMQPVLLVPRLHFGLDR